MRRIRKCPACGLYTLKDDCAKCGQKTIEPRPPRYSPEDRYSDYRRRAKERLLAEQGML